MSDRTAYVYVDLDGKPVLVGTLYARFRKNRESATFTYDASWLSHPSRFALEPALVLYDLSHHTHAGQAIFGAFGDSAPDRWGRMLMRRAERQRAKAEKRQPHPLNEIDCLLGVDDETRLQVFRNRRHDGSPNCKRSRASCRIVAERGPKPRYTGKRNRPHGIGV